MNDNAFTITFYSYRGGADRLTALVNVGVELARRGRKVLMVDFDLESPGLTALEPLRPEKARPGLMEFVAEYLDTNQAPPVGEYLYRAASSGQKGGELWVMPAGKGDADYWAALARIDWQELYDLHAGYLFFEDARLQWRQEVRPDYVLINSPGGINDLAGICTRQLPDLVMLLSTPAGADEGGLQLACAEIRAEREQNPPKCIDLALVLADVANSADEDPRIFRKRTADFANALGLACVDALLHHDDQFLPEGRPAVQARPRGRAAREYRRLARLCMMANCENDRDGAQWYLKRLQKDLQINPFLAVDAPFADSRQANRRLERLLAKFIRDPEIVLMGTACLFLVRRYQKAMYVLDQALEEQPDAVEIRFRRAEHYARWDRTREAVQDLLRVLDTPGITTDQVKTAMRKLRGLSPEKFEEALHKPVVQALGTIQTKLLSWGGRIPAGVIGPDKSSVFLESHRWAKTIALLEPKVNHSPDFTPWDAFHLAVAYWGVTGKLREDLCKRGIDKFLGQNPEPESDPSDLSDLQLLSVMFWGAGEQENALEILKAAEDRADELQESAEEGRELEFPTFWRSTQVSFDQFKEDCQDQRLMIRLGAVIRPPFLEKEFTNVV